MNVIKAHVSQARQKLEPAVCIPEESNRPTDSPLITIKCFNASLEKEEPLKAGGGSEDV